MEKTFSPRPYKPKVDYPCPSIACTVKGKSVAFRINIGKLCMERIFGRPREEGTDAYFTVTLSKSARDYNKCVIAICDKDTEGAIQGQPGTAGSFSLPLCAWTAHNSKHPAIKMQILDVEEGKSATVELPKWARPHAE